MKLLLLKWHPNLVSNLLYWITVYDVFCVRCTTSAILGGSRTPSTAATAPSSTSRSALATTRTTSTAPPARATHQPILLRHSMPRLRLRTPQLRPSTPRLPTPQLRLRMHRRRRRSHTRPTILRPVMAAMTIESRWDLFSSSLSLFAWWG